MPDQINFTSSSVQIFGISTTEIIVAADVNNIVATSGVMGQYKLTALAPDPASETITPNPADNDTNMTIGNLSPGTSYNLTFVNSLTLCGSTQESDVTIVTEVCTGERVYTL